MLNRLNEYAQRLVVEPGFAPKTARWNLQFTPEGRFLGVVGLGNEAEKKNLGREFPLCPEMGQPEMVRLASRFGEKGAAHFLLDTCDVIALHLKEGETDEGRARAEGKHRVFVRLLREASEAVPLLGILAEALDDPETQDKIQQQLSEKKAKPTDKATFGIEDGFLINQEGWHDWWRRFRRGDAPEGQESSGPQLLSLLSGVSVTPAMTHSKFNLSDVGGMSAGSALISFDKSAFESYGLTQSMNAAMSEKEAKTYHAGLTHLLAQQSVKLVGMRVAYWYDRTIPLEHNPFPWLLTSESQEEANALYKAQQLLDYLRSGDREATEIGRSRYFALTVSGAAGRVMVRNWMEGAFEELAEKVKEWFADLEIINIRGTKSATSPSMERVMTCLLPPKPPATKYDDWIKPIGSLRLPLWSAGLRGEAIPFAVLPRILSEHTHFVLRGEMAKLNEADGETGLRVSLVQTRMALIRAYHVRKAREKGEFEMKIALDPEHPEPAYHCGRLMAVFEDLQRQALNDVNAGVVERYYAACAATPNMVLSRLFKLSNFHLNKLESEGLKNLYRQRISEIMNQVQEGFPRTLDLEKQSLFALGYYHQIASDTARRIENAAKKKARQNADNPKPDEQTLDYDGTDQEGE